VKHPKAFCARPGCRIAYALHSRSAAACANYIDPTSPAGVAILRVEKKTQRKIARHLRLIDGGVQS
jgi:hypothetical protein